MPHIRIDAYYTPNIREVPEAYPGATTLAEAMQYDIDNLPPIELLAVAEDVQVTLVDD